MAVMFGVIVSGRLVQTDFQQVSETQFLTTILEADSINHIVVFLTGAQPFPPEFGGLVYFSWPDSSAPPMWQLLGHISNDKPSAIFKVSNLKKTTEMGNAQSSQFIFGQQKISHNAQIGISVEPLMNVQQQSALVASQQTNSFLEFAQKMLENFFNYAASFAMNHAQMAQNPSETFIPLSTLQSWYTNFERRLQQNPNFWR
ncbi:protein OPI10 homolog [Bacillus rossius redtenbacheri]|uniref:protein OPI10 homolog n=1 Tax=Bacillus rossius redtenbacheri TaxID=93214 RepID=UPI002FDDD4D9